MLRVPGNYFDPPTPDDPDDGPPDREDDCLECGTCNSCIERCIAYAEEMYVSRERYHEIRHQLALAAASGTTEEQCRAAVNRYVASITGEHFGEVKLVVVADDDPRNWWPNQEPASVRDGGTDR